jgi:hypothetical protein
MTPAISKLQPIVKWHGGKAYLARRRFLHQHADHVVFQQQAVQFLHHTAGYLAPQHGTLPSMGLQFIDRDLLLPPLMVEPDQGTGQVELVIQPGFPR